MAAGTARFSRERTAVQMRYARRLNRPGDCQADKARERRRKTAAGTACLHESGKIRADSWAFLREFPKIRRRQGRRLDFFIYLAYTIFCMDIP